MRSRSHVSPTPRKLFKGKDLRVHAVDVRGPIELSRDIIDLVFGQQLARARRVALTERPYAQPWHEYLTSIDHENREFIDLIESLSQHLVTQSGRAEVVAKVCLTVMLASGCVIRPAFDSVVLEPDRASEIIGPRDGLVPLPESGIPSTESRNARLVFAVGSLPTSDPTLADALIAAVVQPCRVRVFG